jgi:hypothetical protein
MNDRPLDESVQERMQQLRCAIDEDMEEMAASARTTLDWKHYVNTYPWMCVGAAVALGFLIVPRRSTVLRPNAATLTELATTGHLVVKPAPSGARRILDSLLATVASIAVHKATTYLGQSAGRVFGITDHPGTRHHDSNCMP